MSVWVGQGVGVGALAWGGVTRLEGVALTPSRLRGPQRARPWWRATGAPPPASATSSRGREGAEGCGLTTAIERRALTCSKERERDAGEMEDRI